MEERHERLLRMLSRRIDRLITEIPTEKFPAVLMEIENAERGARRKRDHVRGLPISSALREIWLRRRNVVKDAVAWAMTLNVAYKACWCFRWLDGIDIIRAL